MNKSKGDAKQIRNNVLAGIAVMNEDLEKAEDLLANIKAGGELLTFAGNRFATFAAIDDEALDGLGEFQDQLEKSKLRYCLALSVPVAQYQTEPTMDASGKVFRDFCSINGLPVRTQSQEIDGKEDATYKYTFKRPSFWLIRAIVDGLGNVNFLATLMGQFRNAEGNLVYRPVTKKAFDSETNAEVEKPITKSLTNPAEGIAERELNVNDRFLFAMVKPCIQQAETARRRNGLRASVNRASVSTPLTSALGETFPGLESLKAKLEAQEAPAKPAADKPVKKSKKDKKTEELVAAE